MSWTRYRTQPKLTGGTPGTAVAYEYEVVKARSSWDALKDQWNQSFPTQFTATVFEEGVDYPFYTRYPTATAYPGRNLAKAIATKVALAQASTLGLGLAFPIFVADPETTPLFVGKSFEFAGRAYEAREANKTFRAIFAKSDAPGAWIEAIPTSVYTVTVCEILSQIQEALLETVNDGVSMGSGLWTMPEVVAYLNNRISRFLMESGVIQWRTTIAGFANQDTYQLPPDLIDLRRTAWTTGSTTRVLARGDSMQADLWNSAWDSATGAPEMSIQVPEASLQIRVAPEPSVDATLDIIYVKDLGPVTNDCSIFPIPDEWTVYIKWGVLSDMLAKEGEANDPQRAAYAEKRWAEGISLAKLYLGTNQ